MTIEVIKVFALSTDVNALSSYFQLEDVDILRAIVFDNDLSGVETMFSSSLINFTKQAVMDK